MCQDIGKEFQKFDADPQKWLSVKDETKHPKYPPITVDVGYERFLGPEVFFHPEVSSEICLGLVYDLKPLLKSLVRYVTCVLLWRTDAIGNIITSIKGVNYHLLNTTKAF